MENPITQREAKLIQSSFHLVDTGSMELTDLFNKTLFERKPELKSLFPESMLRQKKKLLDTLNIIVNGCMVMHKLVPAIEALGKVHKPLAATADDYKLVEDALIESLERYCSVNWTNETTVAWRKVYRYMANIMMSV